MRSRGTVRRVPRLAVLRAAVRTSEAVRTFPARSYGCVAQSSGEPSHPSKVDARRYVPLPWIRPPSGIVQVDGAHRDRQQGTLLASQGNGRRTCLRRQIDLPGAAGFFGDQQDQGDASQGFAEDASGGFSLDFLGSAEGLQLNRAFVKISDPKIRRKIIDLVKTLASDDD